MARQTTPEQDESPASSGPALEAANVPPAVIDAWWDSVLAGNVYEPHPIHGPSVKVRLDGNQLRLSGELESPEDCKELIRQARERIGHGIDRVDTSDLTLARRDERPGILDQTLMSAFPNREAADYARAFVIKHSRVVPKEHHIVDSAHMDEMPDLMAEDLIPDARKALEKGKALLVLKVDETEAFRVRELLEEDTRSQWTIAAPPTLTKDRR
jgi:hypothetical protein